jgi:hypothetical protein
MPPPLPGPFDPFLPTFFIFNSEAMRHSKFSPKSRNNRILSQPQACDSATYTLDDVWPAVGSVAMSITVLLMLGLLNDSCPAELTGINNQNAGDGDFQCGN